MGMIRPQIREAYRRKQGAVADHQKTSANDNPNGCTRAGAASASKSHQIRPDERDNPTPPEQPMCASS